MNEVLLGQVRHLVGAAGAALAAKGYITGAMVEPIVGITLVVLATLWSAFAKKYNIKLVKVK